MRKRIFVFLIYLMVGSNLGISCEDSKEGQITENRGILELKGRVSLRLDSKGSKYIVITVINKTSKILWIPKPSSDNPKVFTEKNIGIVGCESINWYVETGTNRPISSHEDRGLCEFPRSYSKLLPNKSAVYLLKIGGLLNATERNKEIKLSKFKVGVWAPWRLKNGQRVGEDVKKATVAKQVDTYETIIVQEALARAKKKKSVEETHAVKPKLEEKQIDVTEENRPVILGVLIEKVVASGSFIDLKVTQPAKQK